MIYIVVRYNCNVLLLTAIPPVIRSAASLLTIADTRKAERLFDFSPANVIPFFPVTPRTDLVEFDRVLGYYNKFRPGTKWVLLRGSAEAIKREIYCYRSRTGVYGEDLCSITVFVS